MPQNSIPKKVEEYADDIKKKNPDYDESQVWATAWSIYCKYKNPGSDHCKKPTSEYFPGKKASAQRVASRYLEASPLSLRRDYGSDDEETPETRVASRYLSAAVKDRNLKWKEGFARSYVNEYRYFAYQVLRSEYGYYVRVETYSNLTHVQKTLFLEQKGVAYAYTRIREFFPDKDEAKKAAEKHYAAEVKTYEATIKKMTPEQVEIKEEKGFFEKLFGF
jgi:hypothetical protein